MEEIDAPERDKGLVGHRGSFQFERSEILERGEFLQARVGHMRAAQGEVSEVLERGQVLQARVGHLRGTQGEVGQILQACQFFQLRVRHDPAAPAHLDPRYWDLQYKQLEAELVNMGLDANSARQQALATLITNAKNAGIEDNDWVELFNTNGAIAARAVVSQRVNPGMVLMYHAQEKIINTPGSEITGMRGGIHNSVTRVVLKPTHMIGGYAQLSYGFNYYGTIGTNRDEFVVVRKMRKVDWLDEPAQPGSTAEAHA